MKKVLTLSMLLLSPALLVACGEGQGWEKQLTNTMFPYGNQRTAGSGVAYVLAKMMPEKALKLESVQRKIKPSVIEAPASNKLSKMLKQSQSK